MVHVVIIWTLFQLDKASNKLNVDKLEYAEQAAKRFLPLYRLFGVYRDGQCLAGMTEALTD
ncbi:hypothetical protein NXV44_00120 [Bacteroides thetaiotaomicron]|nr:hypothetical protein [Bacteroides thetaiotaomicron]